MFSHRNFQALRLQVVLEFDIAGGACELEKEWCNGNWRGWCSDDYDLKKDKCREKRQTEMYHQNRSDNANGAFYSFKQQQGPVISV